MKRRILSVVAISAMLLSQFACEPGIQESNIPGETQTKAYTYSVEVDLVNKSKAPALQSFVHGVDGNNWLLFAGRTNRADTVGGLHNLNANYADKSFIPKSYNTDILVYDLEKDTTWRMPYDSLLKVLKNNYCSGIDSDLNVVSECQQYLTDNLSTIFSSSNPIVTQEGNTLYVLGGYGAEPGDTNNYMTYNQIVTINVPSMIKVVKGNSGDLLPKDWRQLIQLGKDETNTLVSTGAEMFMINGTLYLAGGHNFGSGQKYLDAVYPFTITENAAPYKLNVNVQTAISDVADPKATESDNTSKFRRRDGPITASVFFNSTNQLTEGFTFYGGVFKPGDDTLKAWNDAIYIHPDIYKSYEIDSNYDQKNNSVYACSDFTAYDSINKIVHTFLLGGIGDGAMSSDSTLSSFTNSGVHIKMNLASTPTSSMKVLKNVINEGRSPYYGAESVLIKSKSLAKISVDDGHSEVLHLNNIFTTDSVLIGHIYGGIEAFEKNPGTYGHGKSAASNKIWKVTLKRTENN